MRALTYEQIRALHGRAGLDAEPFHSRRQKGVRDAQYALAALLRQHADDPEALAESVRAYLAEGPAWDNQDYHDGGMDVHRDVSAVLDGNAIVILDLLDALDFIDTLARTPAPAAARETE